MALAQPYQKLVLLLRSASRDVANCTSRTCRAASWEQCYDDRRSERQGEERSLSAEPRVWPHACFAKPHLATVNYGTFPFKALWPIIICYNNFLISVPWFREVRRNSREEFRTSVYECVTENELKVLVEPCRQRRRRAKLQKVGNCIWPACPIPKLVSHISIYT